MYVSFFSEIFTVDMSIWTALIQYDKHITLVIILASVFCCVRNSVEIGVLCPIFSVQLVGVVTSRELL